MSPRHRHERGLRRGYRREVGCDLRARRGGLRGRAGRDRVHVHGGSGLAPDRALPPLLGHARRHAPQVHARRRRRGRDEPVEQVQRAHLRRRPQSARLRARHELARPRAARRDARDDREPLRGQGAEQPERRVRPLERGDPLLGPVVRPHARLRRGARAGARASRASTGSRPAAASPSSSSTATPTSSRTASASRPTSRSCTSTTRRGRTSTSTTPARTGGRRTAAASSPGSAAASSRRASPTG